MKQFTFALMVMLFSVVVMASPITKVGDSETDFFTSKSSKISSIQTSFNSAHMLLAKGQICSRTGNLPVRCR